MGELTSAIVQIARSFGDLRPWWRGHKDVSWQLAPSLYRRGLTSSEINLNGRFKLMAPVRYDKCPEEQDSLGWLYLMQHYRLPTRLLDWSESPLVALYFALERKFPTDDVDAAIWAMLPTKLNLHQRCAENIFVQGHSDLRRLSTDAFVKNTEDPDTRTLAVQMKQSDLRHMVQQAVVTIHGTDTPIEKLPEPESFLTQIRIPAASKSAFRQILALYGISRASLFPDLENLAHELASLFEGHT